MEVPRLGLIQSYRCQTTPQTQDPSLICDLDCSSRQHQLPHPLSKAMNPTHILKDTSQDSFCCATVETLRINLFISGRGKVIIHTQRVRVWLSLNEELAREVI